MCKKKLIIWGLANMGNISDDILTGIKLIKEKELFDIEEQRIRRISEIYTV